jgi:preprotein translocase subunit SecD
LALLVCGCQGAGSADMPAVSAGNAAATPSAGQVALSVPVELREVLQSAPCTTQNPVTTTSSAADTVLRDVDGVDCYQVSPPLMEFQQLDAINVASQPPASQYVISMTLTPSDAQNFASLTEQHDRQQLAYVVRGTVLSTQAIAQPVTNGVLQLQGNFSQDDANRLVRQITS